MEADLDDITWVIREFGEDKHARRIAKGIIAYQKTKKNGTVNAYWSNWLAYLRRGSRALQEKAPSDTCIPSVFVSISTSELEGIDTALKGAASILAPQGRISVISFLS
ncbi:16S rRNA (cytosine(1402)-N(4))-methyltransferase [Vibrio lentus]|nr:16S rRNA (cytosine(1402)-N(4))-methyltransferase [Vibrio lentus]